MRNFLQETAWQFILDEGISALPVYPSRIIKKHCWGLLTYTEYAARVHQSVPEVIRKYDQEAFVFWSNREQSFIICYNDSFPPDVIRWTLMHEIGHIILGHVTPAVPALSRVRSEERTLFETEAQGFARRVLCPSIILHDCGAIEPEQIMQLCGVSHEASTYRSAYMKILEARGKFRIHPLERMVEAQFKDFLDSAIKNNFIFMVNITFLGGVGNETVQDRL